MKLIYRLQRALTLSVLLTVLSSPMIAKAGPSGSSGGFKDKTATTALKMAVKDILEFLPSLSHSSLNEKNKKTIKTALNNLVMEPNGQPRYRNGERLFMDYEESPPKIIATEGFFEKYSSISEQKKYGFGKSEAYYQIRKDLLHEVAHLILKDKNSLRDPEAAAEQFTEKITLNYTRFIPTTLLGIYSVTERVYLYEPSELIVMFGAFPYTLKIKLQPNDIYGTKYSGSISYTECNNTLEATLKLNFSNGKAVSGVLFSIPPKYSYIPCSQLEKYQESKTLKGFYQ